MLVETGDDDNDESPPHWNPELVAKLEAERATYLRPISGPRKPAPLDSAEDIAKRRQIALEMMRRG